MIDAYTLGDQVTDSYLFKGPKQKPFLAPRAVYVASNILLVSDTGQNRVLIWNTIPTEEYQEPNIILGQTETVEVGRNSGSAVTANTLHYPSGIWSNGTKLIVADAWNHRVLIWHTLPTSNAQSADVVLGQPDFKSNRPNVKGIAHEPTAKTLNWPYGVFSDGKKLWIADTGNRRVLFYENIPLENYSPANNVIGKTNFNSRDYSSTDPIWPYSVKISEQGKMAIVDTQFYRVLVWNNYEDAFTKDADIIIGQSTFDHCGQNQFHFLPESNTLSWVYDTFFYRHGLLVTDTGNSRILYFDDIPKQHNEPATQLVGRTDFNLSSDFKGNKNSTTSAIYWPFSIATENNKLFIADTGNHRLVITNLKF